jgi:hypothetical protein
MKFAALLMCLCVVGCQSTPVLPPPGTAPVSVSGRQVYSDAEAGISFSYPADWKRTAKSSTQMKLSAPGNTQFTLDIPVLPFHIPGMIPLASVESGYVDDFKKRMPDAVVYTEADPTVPEAKQGRMLLTGHVDGKSAVDDVAIIVHDDRIYILAVDSDSPSARQMSSALDGILQSLRWTK